MKTMFKARNKKPIEKYMDIRLYGLRKFERSLKRLYR